MSCEDIKNKAYIESLEKLIDELVIKKHGIKGDYNYMLNLNKLNENNIGDLENEVTDLEIRLKESLEGKLVERERYIQSDNRVEELENEIGDLYNKYLKSKEEKEGLQSDFNALFDDFNKKCDSNEYLNKTNENLERENIDLREDIDKLTAVIDYYENQQEDDLPF
jgi:chromosome segregation ATPase